MGSITWLRDEAGVMKDSRPARSLFFISRKNLAANCFAVPSTLMPNFDAASARLAGLLQEMGVPEAEIPVLYQALESLAIGSVLVDYTGHPLHLVNRRQRRRMSGVPAFEGFSRADDTTKAVSDAAFELSLSLLLDECERRGQRPSS